MGHILIYKITKIGHAFWLVKNPWFFVPVPHFLRVTGVISHLGCWENTRKACKSPAFGSRFTSFSRVLPTSRVAYDAGRPIESVVYYLNNQHDKILWIYNCNTPHISYIHHFHIDHDAPRLRETSVFKNFPIWQALNMGFSVNIFNGRVDKRFNSKDTCTLGARDFFMRGFRFRPEDLSACARDRRIPPQARKLFVLRVAKRALNAQSRIQRVW